MRRIGIAALAALLLVAAWLLLLDRRHELAPAGPVAAPEPAAPAAPARAQGEGPAGRAPVEPQEEPHTNRPLKAGGGRFGLHGRVVDEAGQSVPGAWVAAYSSPFPLLDFEFELDEILTKPLQISLEPLAATRAEGDGRFQLSGVPGRTVFLAARAPQRLTPGRQRVLPEELDREEGVLLRTAAGAALEGTVLDSEGRVVAGAEILVGPGLKYLPAALRNRSFFADRAFTDGAGRFALEAVPASQALTASAFAGSVRSGFAEVEPLPRGGAGAVEIRLDPLGGLSGAVQDADGRPAAGAAVVAVPLDLRRLVPFARDPGGWTAATGSGGRFHFPELPLGSFLLLALGSQGRSAPAQAAVTGPDSAAPLLVLDSRSSVEGRVLDESGKPVVAAKVELRSIPRRADPGGETGDRPGSALFRTALEMLPELLPEPTVTRTDGQGRFRIPAWRGARLRASAAGFLQSDYDLTGLAAERRPALLLVRPGAVEGVAVDPEAGRPVQFFLARGEPQELAGEATQRAGRDEESIAVLGDADAERARDRRLALERAVLEREFPEVTAALEPDEALLLPARSWRAKIQATAFCDHPEGRFRLNGLAPGSWTIQALADGYAPGEAEGVRVRPGEVTRGIVLELGRGATVSGRVVARSNALPVADAVVTVGHGEELGFAAMLQGLGGATALGTTAEDGSFTVSGAGAGSDHVNVAAAGYAPATVALPPLQPDEERSGVVVELSAGGALAGVVSDRHGAPLPGRMVAAVSVQARDFQQTATDSRGTYRMGHMRPGAYFVLALALDDDSLFSGDFARLLTSSRFLTAYVAEGEVTTVDIVDESAGGCRLRGQVVAAGQPLPGANLAVFAAGGQGLLDFRISTARTDEGGEFEFQSLAPGDYLLNVDSREWDGQLEISVADVAEDYLRVEVPQGEVRGAVVAGHTGDPVASASVALIHEDSPAIRIIPFLDPEDQGGRKWADADEGGLFRFRGLSPGRYRLEVRDRAPWRQPDDATGAPPLGTLQLPAFQLGANEVRDLGTVRLPLAGVIRVRVSDASGAALEQQFSLQATRLQPEGGAEETAGGPGSGRGFGRQGRGEVRGLEPGSYRLVVEARGYAPSTVEPVVVQEGAASEAAVTMRRGATLRVRLLDGQNRPVSGAAVELLGGEGWSVNPRGGLAAGLASLLGGSGDGSFELGTFAPGDYRLRATWRGETHETPLTLLEGEERLVEIRF